MALRYTISTALAAALLLAAPTSALAQPPAAGTVHTFADPVFNGTVICDTLDQVRAIATAESPDDVYANYYLTTNAVDEPICMAIVPTGLVVDVVPLGVMERTGKRYQAWAIETQIGDTTVFALYLERDASISA
jgi:hypothetical protein